MKSDNKNLIKKIHLYFFTIIIFLRKFVISFLAIYDFVYKAVNKEFYDNIFIHTIGITSNKKIHRLILFFKNLYYSRMYFLFEDWMMHENPQKMAHYFGSRTKIKNLEFLLEAFQTNNPIILYSAHIGFHYLPLMCSKITETMIRIGLKRKLVIAGAFYDDYEKLENRLNNYLPVECRLLNLQNPNSIQIMFNELRNNSIINCLLDIDLPNSPKRDIKFLNHFVPRAYGIIELGRLCNSILLPHFVFEEKNSFIIEYQKPVQIYNTSNKNEDILKYLNHTSFVIETKIKELPEQWTLWESLERKPFILDLQLTKNLDLYFYKNYEEKTWPKERIIEISKQYNEWKDSIKDIFHLIENPSFCFFPEKCVTNIKNEFSIKHRGNIIQSWDKILIFTQTLDDNFLHDLHYSFLYAAINMFLKEKQTSIPYWFKQVIINILLNKIPTKDDLVFIKEILNHNGSHYCNLLDKENLLLLDKNYTIICDSLSRFLIDNFTIKQLQKHFSNLYHLHPRSLLKIGKFSKEEIKKQWMEYYAKN